MELKEGMYYTRSEDGRLGLCKCEGMTPEQYVETYKKRYHIKKASYNIIDLIEVGDYVNGHQVYDDFRADTDDYGNNFIEIGIESDRFLNHYIREDEIKSIVTKEQFESMSYKVKE